MTRIIITRHGQSIANENDIFAGYSDFDLTELGKRQASAVAGYLVKNERIDAIYSSDLLRAYHTATPVAEALNIAIVKDTQLREIFGGEWEGLTFTEIAERYPEDMSVWTKDYSHSCPVGGESTKHVYERVVPHICSVAKENDGKCVLFSTHATVLRAFTAYALGLSADEVGNISFAHNSSINIFEYDKGKVSVVKTNIIEHLGGMVTSLPDIINA